MPSIGAGRSIQRNESDQSLRGWGVGEVRGWWRCRQAGGLEVGGVRTGCRVSS